MIYKVDLHTHSIISPDGGISAKKYREIFDLGILDCVAITDHNEMRFAKKMQEEFGEKIIVGEEITTTEGEIIGLFLEKKIPGGLSAKETVVQIKLQNGLIYIPHPFETFRKGIQQSTLEEIVKDVDIIEGFNGRGKWRGKADEASKFAHMHGIPMAASSDAHGYMGIGFTYSKLKKMPERKLLKKLLLEGEMEKEYAPLISYLTPFVNKVKNKIVLGV